MSFSLDQPVTKNRLQNSIIKFRSLLTIKLRALHVLLIKNQLFLKMSREIDTKFPFKNNLQNLKRASNREKLIIATIVEIKKRRGQAVSSLF